MRTIIVFLLFISKAFSQSCVLDVSDRESPFIVNENFTFPDYVNVNQFTFSQDELFYVVCPQGTHNFYIAEDGDRVACKNDSDILIIRTVEIIDFGNIKCKPHDVTTVKNSGEKCARNGTIFEVGFNIYKNFHPQYKICFDEVKLTPIYSKFKNLHDEYSDGRLHPQLQDGRCDGCYNKYICDNNTNCGWTDSGNAYPNVNMDAVYDNQMEIFQNLGISNVDFLPMKVPLTSNMLYYTYYVNQGQKIRNAPYYNYINVVPVWDWNEYLNLLYLINYTSENDVVGPVMCTGTLGVATLPNNDGEQVELYLSDGKVPVPKWFWIVMDKSESILFYYNHPNSAEAETDIGKICSEYAPELSCNFASVTDPEMKQLIDNCLN